MATGFKRKKTEFYVTLGIAILAVSACAVTAACGGMATFAWFSAKRTDEVAIENIIANSPEMVDSVSIYPFHTLTASEGTSSSATYTFEKTALTENVMGKYSILKPDGHGVLIEITLSSYALTADALKVSAFSNATYYLGQINPATGKLYTPLTLDNNSLSSIVCFYSFLPTSIVDQNTYFSVDLATTINSTGASMNFVSSNTLVNYVPMCDVAQKPNKLYVILDYDAALIEDIYSANIGNSVINDITHMDSDGQSYLTYINDFYFSINPYFGSTEASS